MSHSIIKSTVVGTTAQAVLLKLDGNKIKWVPRSVIRNGESISQAHQNPWILDWWIEKEEL